MNDTQKYFIHLLSSHLNNSPPLPNEKADWMGVFKLGELHNLTAMLCIEIKKLPPESRPPQNIMSLFNQALGMAIQSYENKMCGINNLIDTLSDNKIDHLFLKGAAIRKYYPVAEVRTSGDTDVVVDKDNLKSSADILLNNGFTLTQQSDIQNVMFFKDEEFEIKNYFDCINDKCEDYFASSFDENKCCKENEHTYFLLPVYHLIYVCSHILKHFKTGGAGIRQLMDIDVLLRSGEIDLNEFFKIAKELDLEKSFSVLIALSKRYFNTPINFDYEINDKLYSMLEKVILEGGVFGFAISDSGTTRLIESINTSGKSNMKASLKALFLMFFPKKEYFYRCYPYCAKFHILLPVAYFQRLFEAVFSRGKTNAKSIKTIFSDRGTAQTISDILNELEIK